MDAVIYTRVSRDKDKNKGSGRSVGRSVEAKNGSAAGVQAERLAGAGGLLRQLHWREPLFARQAGMESTQGRDLRKGDVLVVWEASRAQRDLAEYVLLRDLCADRGVPLAYASGGGVLDLTEGDGPNFVGGLDSLIAEREAEILRTRVLRGKRTSATDGRPMTKPPWGYTAPGRGRHGPTPAAVGARTRQRHRECGKRLNGC